MAVCVINADLRLQCKGQWHSANRPVQMNIWSQSCRTQAFLHALLRHSRISRLGLMQMLRTKHHKYGVANRQQPWALSESSPTLLFNTSHSRVELEDSNHRLRPASGPPETQMNIPFPRPQRAPASMTKSALAKMLQKYYYYILLLNIKVKRLN